MPEEDPSSIVKVEEDEPRELSVDEVIERSDLSQDDVDRAGEVAKESLKNRPHVTLTEYQKLIVTIKRRFLAFMICRQGGKTFAATLRIVRKVLESVLQYYIFSRSERQSGNAVAQAAAHLRAIEKALGAKGKRIGSKPAYASQKLRYIHADGSELEYHRLTIRLPSGARIIGLPASPDTTVGISGAMYCDEFALHRDSRAIYARLFPIVSRRKEYEFLVTSTPRGVGNKFYEIMTSDDYEDIFARIVIDIFAAIEQGLVLYDYDGNPIKDDDGIEKLRKALKDPDAWDEEYLVKFIDDVLNLLTYELIGRCERLHNEDGKPYDILRMPTDYNPARTDLGHLLQPYLKGGDIYLGFDQARSKNLSVIWVDEDIEHELWQRALIVMQNKDFEFQEAVLWQFMKLDKLRKAGIDATGLGSRTAERTVTRFGERALAINFSGRLKDRKGESHQVKSLLARVILERHQDATDHYPVLDIIRDDFHRVKRKRGGSPDQFTYFADNDETGHADIFTAKALCDVVAQELREYGGIVDGMRIGDEDPDGFSIRLYPDHSGDYSDKPGEFAGIGAAIM